MAVYMFRKPPLMMIKGYLITVLPTGKVHPLLTCSGRKLATIHSFSAFSEVILINSKPVRHRETILKIKLKKEPEKISVSSLTNGILAVDTLYTVSNGNKGMIRCISTLSNQLHQQLRFLMYCLSSELPIITGTPLLLSGKQLIAVNGRFTSPI